MLSKLTNHWFYQPAPFIFRIFLIFVNGDIILLLPLIILIILSVLFSTKLFLYLLFCYIIVRNFGEMIYWIAQQFSNTGYRPYDFGMKQLNNKAIYIIYQTGSIVSIIIGLAGLYLLIIGI